MRRILWCIISFSLVFVSAALLLRLHDETLPLPEPLDALVGCVEEALSLPSPEHAEDGFRSDGTANAVRDAAEGQAEESGPDEDREPDIYESNPRYTVEQDPEQGEILRSEVQRGDTAGKILGEWLDSNDLAELLAAAKPIYALERVRFGQGFFIVREPRTGVFRSFHYEINPEKSLVVEKKEGRFVARLEETAYQTSLAVVRGTIRSTLSESVAEQGESVALAIALATVFASEINFITDLREGDSFEVVVEKRFHDNDFEGYGRVLGAKFTNQRKQHAAYLFHNERGREAYYTAEGDSLHRQLLKAPLSFLRVTSKYSMARRHPVFGTVRPHQGIDYGAPTGTPIMAVGDGVITSIGRAGGYGKQIVIRHDNGLESLYGHMSRYAGHMKDGKRVRQGQTIGYVGATGTATGPHLDFRIRRQGRFVNPDKLIIPRDQGLDARRMAEYKAVVQAVDAYLAGGDTAGYNPDVWFRDED